MAEPKRKAPKFKRGDKVVVTLHAVVDVVGDDEPTTYDLRYARTSRMLLCIPETDMKEDPDA